jgi:hypothetical protein
MIHSKKSLLTQDYINLSTPGRRMCGGLVHYDDSQVDICNFFAVIAMRQKAETQSSETSMDAEPLTCVRGREFLHLSATTRTSNQPLESARSFAKVALCRLT